MKTKKSEKLSSAYAAVATIDNVIAPFVPRFLKPLRPIEIALAFSAGKAYLKEELDAKEFEEIKKEAIRID